MKHYPVENVYLYTSRHFRMVPIQKSSALCDNCLVYSSSLVSNNYIGSINCSVENNFHLLVNLLFPIAFLFRLLSVWNIIQLRMSIFTLHVIFALVPIQKSSALWDNCLVYRTSLISNNYLGSNKCSVDNNLHFSRECLVSICFLFRVLSVWNIIQLRMSIFTLHVISAWFLFRKAVLCEITVLSTALL